MQAGNPRRVLSRGRVLPSSWSISGAPWGPDPTAALIAGPPSSIAWLSSDTRKPTPKKTPPDLRNPCQSQPPCPQARKVRESLPPLQGAAATGKEKAPKPSWRKSPICALSVEMASQKLQPSSSIEAAIQVSPCEIGVETRGLSLLRGALAPPKNHVGKGGQPYQIVEKWRIKNPGENSAFTSVIRNLIKLLVGATYNAVEKNCWVRNPINM